MNARVLVSGAGGQVGYEVVAELSRRDATRRKGGRIEVIATTHHDLDVGDRDAVLATVLITQPEVIIHVAAFTAVDACESEPDRAFRTNALGTRHIQEAASAVGAHLLYVSTDYVFDGTLERPYVEWDQVNPLSVYGRSKRGGELECDASTTIVRTSWVCGRSGPNMMKTVLKLATASDGPLRFVDDQRGCPTIAADLATVVCDLALSRRPGIFHVTNQDVTTWFGFAQFVVGAIGGDIGRVQPISTSELIPARLAPRPANSVLDNAALRLCGLPLLRDWQDALSELIAEPS